MKNTCLEREGNNNGKRNPSVWEVYASKLSRAMHALSRMCTRCWERPGQTAGVQQEGN